MLRDQICKALFFPMGQGRHYFWALFHLMSYKPWQFQVTVERTFLHLDMAAFSSGSCHSGREFSVSAEMHHSFFSQALLHQRWRWRRKWKKMAGNQTLITRHVLQLLSRFWSPLRLDYLGFVFLNFLCGDFEDVNSKRHSMSFFSWTCLLGLSLLEFSQ